MEGSKDFIRLMDNSIKRAFSTAFKISMKNLPLALFAWKTMRRQKKASKLRAKWEVQGVHVPPYMIASITNRCNLHCKGCYARAHKRDAEEEMSIERWRNLFEESTELGISVIMLAGGEPFVRRELMGLAGDYRNIIFPVFTNGTLLDDEVLKILEKTKNIIPVLSIEGLQKDTDERRGAGIFDSISGVISKMHNKGIFFGTSITVTSSNFDAVTDYDFIKKLIDSGCKLFFFVEFVPVEEGTEELIPSIDQRRKLADLLDIFEEKYPGIFVGFPGDEEKFGGCLAAGRGFVHVSPSGRLEPCPFAPYSDTNLKDITLRDALKSELLKEIRQNHENLTETKGGCVLWTNREWVKSLLDDTKRE